MKLNAQKISVLTKLMGLSLDKFSSAEKNLVKAQHTSALDSESETEYETESDEEDQNSLKRKACHTSRPNNREGDGRRGLHPRQGIALRAFTSK